MKNRATWLLPFIILSLLHSMLGANPSCKVIKGITELNQRLFNAGVTLGNKLDVKVNGNPDIPSAARFDNPELGHKWDAMLQIRYALGNCERHWPNGPNDETLEAFSDMLLSKRVIDAADIDYETVGAGFGKIMARYSSSADPNVQARGFLANLKNSLDDEPFLSAGYTEAHYFRDINEIFAELPDGDTFDDDLLKNFIDSQTNGNANGSIYYEVRVAGARKGEGLRQLSVDAKYEGLNGVNTGIDVLTHQGAYNVARSYQTVWQTKLADGNIPDIAKAIVKARADGNPYKFIVGIVGDVPPELNAQLVKLNQAIRLVDDVPSDFPEFTTSDILPAF